MTNQLPSPSGALLLPTSTIAQFLAQSDRDRLLAHHAAHHLGLRHRALRPLRRAFSATGILISAVLVWDSVPFPRQLHLVFS